MKGAPPQRSSEQPASMLPSMLPSMSKHVRGAEHGESKTKVRVLGAPAAAAGGRLHLVMHPSLFG